MRMSVLWIYMGLLVLLLVGLGVGMFFYIRSLRPKAEGFEPSEQLEQIAAAFRTGLGREPTPEEVQKVQDANLKEGDFAQLQEFVQTNFKKTDEGVSAAVETAFLSFDKALKDVKESGETEDRKKALVMTYSSLFCMCIKTQTVRDFQLYMEEKYKSDMAYVMKCVREYPDIMKRCNRADVNAVDAAALETADACNVFCGTNFEAAYSLMDKEEVEGCAGKCALLTKVQTATPTLPATNNLTSVQSSGAAAAISTADAPTVVDAANVSYDRPDCTNTKLYDTRKQREMDDMRAMCERSTKYINADDLGKLLPDQKWSVPQTRPPVCLTDAKCEVQPVIIQPASALQVTPFIASSSG